MIFHDIFRDRKKPPLDLGASSTEKEEVRAPSSGKVKIQDMVQGDKSGKVVLPRQREQKNIRISPLVQGIDAKETRMEPLSHPAHPRFFLSPRHPLFVFVLLGTTLLILLSLLVPYGKAVVLQDKVRVYATDGFGALLQAGKDLEQMRFSDTPSLFLRAQRDFEAASLELTRITQFHRFVTAQNGDLAAYYKLLEVGHIFSLAGTKYVQSWQRLDTFLRDFQRETVEKNRQTYPSLTQYVEETFQLVRAATEEVNKGKELLATLNTSVFSQEERSKLDALQVRLQHMQDTIAGLEVKLPVLLDLLGDRYPRTYLILLQNQDEMRPTGGFIGSVLFVTFNDGWMTDLVFRDVYDLDGQLQEKILPPYPLSLISGQHGLRDANVSPDFGASAAAIQTFLTKEKAPSVDGILAINQSLLQDLLVITGPVTVPNTNITFDADNFSFLMSYIVESKLNKEAPKDMLGKFIPVFLEKLKDVDPLRIGEVVLKHLEQRDLAFHSSLPEVQKITEELKLAGSLAPLRTGEDYLLLSETSISGNKSDRYMQTELGHETFIDQQGRVMNRVTFAREHRFEGQEELKWQEIVKRFQLPPLTEGMKNLLGKGENVAYLRAYVPKGSVLIDSVGVNPAEVKVEEESDRTVFGFFMRTFPQNKKTVTLIYQLPASLEFSPTDTYRLLLEKQIGGKNMPVIKKIYVDNNLTLHDTFPSDPQDHLKLETNLELSNQLFFSALIGEKK